MIDPWTEERFAALRSTTASAKVQVEYVQTGDLGVGPVYVEEIIKRLRGAGFTEIELVVVTPALEGAPGARSK